MRYSVQPRGLIFVKGYAFFSFAKNIGKNIVKYINKNLSGEYSQKLLDHAKESATDALETSSKRVFQKTAETTGYLTGNKIADRITKVSKTSSQNNSQTMTIENDKEIPQERYRSLEKRQGIIDELISI